MSRPQDDGGSVSVSGNETATETDRMLTGDAFLASLEDGREVWYDGERVADVVNHRAFATNARVVASLYDALHQDSTRDVLTTVDRFGHRTHRFFAPAYCAADLAGGRDAIAAWQRMTFCWMGRTPDYKASFMAQLAEGHALREESDRLRQESAPLMRIQEVERQLRNLPTLETQARQATMPKSRGSGVDSTG